MIIKATNLNMVYSKNSLNSNGKVALKNINISIGKGKTVGLVGESGSGKTTIGHILAGMIKPTKGEIYFNDEKISYPYKGYNRKNIQVIFQHPEVSYNPKLNIIKSLEETYKMYVGPNYKEQMREDMKLFGIYEEHLYRYPNQLSGGELQRATIMRILSVRPKFVVLDEVTSMLDIISQAQIINLLKEYQLKYDVAYLFISHNEELCKNFCDELLYIKDGELIEYAI